MLKSISTPWVYLVALLIVIATISLHFADKADSMLNDKNQLISETYLQYVVDIHELDPTFNRRPLTTQLIKFTSSLFSVSIGKAFIIANFFLYYLSALALYHLSKIVGASNKLAAVNMIIYLLWFSNMFMFFPPIYSYDEPLQYLLIFLTLIAYFRKKYVVAVLVFSLAIIARESSLFLLPAFALFFVYGAFKWHWKNLIYPTLLMLIPIIIYGVYTIYWIVKYDISEAVKADLGVRLTGIKLNFENSQAASETIIALYLMLGVPLVFIYWKSIQQKIVDENKKWINAFLLTAFINTTIVLTITKACEARLFVMPLFFIWPIFSQTFAHSIKDIFLIQNYRALFSKWQLAFTFIALNLLSYLVAQHLYVNVIGGDDWFTEYLMVINYIVIATFIFNRNKIAKLI